VNVVRGGRTTYGHDLGILIMDVQFPRVPGDVGNASTWPFPVVYRVVHGATIQRTVVDADPSLLEPFLEGARELERMGVRAITTTCGFLAMFQPEMTAAVRVPVYTSSLLLVPLVAQTIGRGRRVGVITANAAALTERHFQAVGWSSESIRMAVQGMEDTQAFFGAFGRNGVELDVELAGREMVDAACKLVAEYPDTGALVLECTNMAPFAHLVQSATGLPVFDLQVLVTMMVQASRRTPYQGFM
jgi:Asp/Glu/hydantoin racemase